MDSNSQRRIGRSARLSSRAQRGFAIATKALVISLGVSGIGLIAITNHEPRPEAVSRRAVASDAPVEAQPGDTDPDAELRQWLREPQSPPF